MMDGQWQHSKRQPNQVTNPSVYTAIFTRLPNCILLH